MAAYTPTTTHSEKVKALVQLVYEATSERTFENVCLVVCRHIKEDFGQRSKA